MINFRKTLGVTAACALSALSLHAAQASATVLYDADASSAYADEWVAGNAYDVGSGVGTLGNNVGFTTTTRIRRVTTPTPPSPHTYAWETTVEDGDLDYYSSSGAQRTEMGMGNPTRVMADRVSREQRQGDVRFIAYNMYIPRSFTSASWCALNQNKGNGSSGNGPLGLYIWGGRLLFNKSRYQTTTSTDLDILYTSPVVARDRWIKILIEVKWSTGSDGYYALHGDLADGLGFRTLYSRVDGWTLKDNITVHSRLGIYRSAVSGTHSVSWAGFNVSDTRADATTFAFGSSL